MNSSAASRKWRTEQILRDHLARCDVEIESGVEVAAVDADPQALRVTLDVGGRTEVVEPRYLLGAGGAHSVTRHSMREHLVGETYGGHTWSPTSAWPCHSARDRPASSSAPRASSCSRRCGIVAGSFS
jgi:2-polyprenyl-6-methoxyphenol hydroxylase-like FAD-dependent oxidoreductase